MGERPILVVGSGAREHAIVLRLLSEGATVHCAPGNPGIAEVATCHDCAADDIDALVRLAKDIAASLVMVGPEVPLALGLADALARVGIACFGPSRAAAELEASKAFSKAFMVRHGIRTARFGRFVDAVSAQDFALELMNESPSHQVVIKASGLAAGKGVVIANNALEATETIDAMLNGSLGDAGAELVVEEFLPGEEISFHCLVSGTDYVVLPPAQDHKRLLDANLGPNTGGMGAILYPDVATPEMSKRIEEEIVRPTLRGCVQDNIPFYGALFVGILVSRGEPYVLEYNVRFGDPETECLMLGIDTPLLPLLERVATHQDLHATIESQHAACIVLASKNYPYSPSPSVPITGLDAPQTAGVSVLHAGTRTLLGQVQSNGGRVLVVAAKASSREEALAKAYQAVREVHFEGMQFRKDIGICHKPLDEDEPKGA